MTNTKNALSVAIKAANKAGEIHLKYFRKHNTYLKHKNPRDILTKADLESEQSIIPHIQSHFPNHSILSEEAGSLEKRSDYLWVVDPLDGTLNFMHGHPDFAVLISLQKGDDLLCSVIYFPVTQELFTAEKGKGAKKNNQKIQVSNTTDIQEMIAGTQMASKLKYRKINLELYRKLLLKVTNIHAVSTCLVRTLTDLAQGIIDFHFRAGFNYWDYAAAKLLVEEAGGLTSDLVGDNLTLTSDSALYTNGVSHKKLLSLITRVSKD